jgi:lipopolysaccharide exporter
MPSTNDKMLSISRFINFKGELFASTFAYAATAIIKLGSSLVLTRILNPEAYGIIGILFSVTSVLELLSDVGMVALLVRHARGGEKKFIHAVWTIRLVRSWFNFLCLYLLAPFIARLYELPVLTDSLRLFSFWFLLGGLESMSFVLAMRDQRAKIGNYADLGTNAVMTVFVIGLAMIVKDHTAFIYGALLQRMLLTITSHFFYRDIGVGFVVEREASKDQFHFAKFVWPSSMLTLVLSQYDRIVLLKLFDLTLLGVYGLAGNMIGPISGLISHNCRVVLYPRCAEYFRSDPSRARERYYSENSKLIWTITLLPVVVAGFSQSLVGILYDPRYTAAGTILLALGLNGLISSFQGTSENLLVASGRTHVVLVANIIRVCTIAPITLLGYYLFGFNGFLWFAVASGFLVQFYFYREQHKQGLVDARAELLRLGGALAVFAVCLLMSRLLLHFLPTDLIHSMLKLKRQGDH